MSCQVWLAGLLFSHCLQFTLSPHPYFHSYSLSPCVFLSLSLSDCRKDHRSYFISNSELRAGLGSGQVREPYVTVSLITLLQTHTHPQVEMSCAPVKRANVLAGGGLVRVMMEETETTGLCSWLTVRPTGKFNILVVF